MQTLLTTYRLKASSTQNIKGEPYEKENTISPACLYNGTTIIPIHAETKLPAGYVQMTKSNPKISGDSEYYTHVKYYSEPITIIARNQLKRIKDTFSNPNY